MLDTNILSDVVRRPRGIAAGVISRVGGNEVCTSVLVAAELRYGVLKSRSRQLAENVDLLLSTLKVLSLEPPADRHYGEIRDHLTPQGSLIGPNDLLIAAHARATDLILVTANVREFARVPKLRIENWLNA